MKIGRNEICPCGSGKKYKRCCYLNAPAPTQMNNDFALELARNVSRATAMTSPSASTTSSKPKTEDKPKAAAAKKPAAAKAKPKAEKKPAKSAAKPAKATKAKSAKAKPAVANVPSDVSASPVMCYLGLMLEEMLEDGTIKATAKGNLPAKIVRDGSELFSDFAVSAFKVASKDNDFAGANEANFGALGYAREIAEAAGLMQFERGRFRAAEGVVEQYKANGVTSFYAQMLEQALASLDSSVAVTSWDALASNLKDSGTVKGLAEKLSATPEAVKAHLIQGFLQRWGFVTIDPKADDAELNLQPLLG